MPRQSGGSDLLVNHTTHPLLHSPRPLRRTTLAIRLLALWLLTFPAVAAFETEATENRIKAAFIYKFTDFIDWPETQFLNTETPITIALMDADPIADELSQIVVNHTTQERAIAIKKLRPGDSLAGIHILFVGEANTARLGQILLTTQTNPILLVTDSQGALTQGSMINFILVAQRVRFEINLENVEKAKLKLSSRLLAVAQQVYRGAP